MCARTRSAVRWWIGRTKRSIPLRHRNACSTKAGRWDDRTPSAADKRAAGSLVRIT